jgi:ribosomal protein L24E
MITCRYCGRNLYYGIMRDGKRLHFNSDDFRVHTCEQYIVAKNKNPIPAQTGSPSKGQEQSS